MEKRSTDSIAFIAEDENIKPIKKLYRIIKNEMGTREGSVTLDEIINRFGIKVDQKKVWKTTILDVELIDNKLYIYGETEGLTPQNSVVILSCLIGTKGYLKTYSRMFDLVFNNDTEEKAFKKDYRIRYLGTRELNEIFPYDGTLYATLDNGDLLFGNISDLLFYLRNGFGLRITKNLYEDDAQFAELLLKYKLEYLEPHKQVGILADYMYVDSVLRKKKERRKIERELLNKNQG